VIDARVAAAVNAAVTVAVAAADHRHALDAAGMQRELDDFAEVVATLQHAAVNAPPPPSAAVAAAAVGLAPPAAAPPLDAIALLLVAVPPLAWVPEDRGASGDVVAASSSSSSSSSAAPPSPLASSSPPSAAAVAADVAALHFTRVTCALCGVAYGRGGGDGEDNAEGEAVPRLLDCAHTLCTPCVEKAAAAARRSAAAYITCGVCRQPTDIGAAGDESLLAEAAAVMQLAAIAHSPLAVAVQCATCEDAAAAVQCDACPSSAPQCDACFAYDHAPKFRNRQGHRAEKM
jgi:hypothetical protein